MQIDVFTLLPHAFSWLTEQRPLAAVLGSELDLRLWNYRDFTPLTGGQVDDALDAVYGDVGSRRIVALTPQGRQLDQELVEELAEEDAFALLSARFEGFDERVIEHYATDAVSIGPYVLSGGELPAMVVLEAVARRLPGALREESSTYETFAPALEGGFEFPQYTRPAEFRGWRVPDVLLSGDHARIDSWRREQSRERTLS
jgi:tRNA (guanine37-N1)-methyltransferase